jgi:phosphatidylglycerol---prolipoprotein diacylglyceryl transferase
MGYPLLVALGIALAALMVKWQGGRDRIDSAQRAQVHIAAIIGAVLGAYLLQLPADLFGWAAPLPPDVPRDILPLGGRTVLGGILGGWLVVEVVKWRIGLRAPTGDAFAAPLAVALACGRVGCIFGGCCAGQLCEPHWWAWHDATGQPHLPVQFMEVIFHSIAALTCVWLYRTQRGQGRLLAGYLALYAVLRFSVEGIRLHPPLLGPFTWYQLLALALFALAATTWWRRRPRPTVA